MQPSKARPPAVAPKIPQSGADRLRSLQLRAIEARITALEARQAVIAEGLRERRADMTKGRAGK